MSTTNNNDNTQTVSQEETNNSYPMDKSELLKRIKIIGGYIVIYYKDFHYFVFNDMIGFGDFVGGGDIKFYFFVKGYEKNFIQLKFGSRMLNDYMTFSKVHNNSKNAPTGSKPTYKVNINLKHENHFVDALDKLKDLVVQNMVGGVVQKDGSTKLKLNNSVSSDLRQNKKINGKKIRTLEEVPKVQLTEWITEKVNIYTDVGYSEDGKTEYPRAFRPSLSCPLPEIFVQENEKLEPKRFTKLFQCDLEAKPKPRFAPIECTNANIVAIPRSRGIAYVNFYSVLQTAGKVFLPALLKTYYYEPSLNELDYNQYEINEEEFEMVTPQALDNKKRKRSDDESDTTEPDNKKIKSDNYSSPNKDTKNINLSPDHVDEQTILDDPTW